MGERLSQQQNTKGVSGSRWKKGRIPQSAVKTGGPTRFNTRPLLFTLYVSPIGDICHQNNINFHGYADDAQNYLHFRPDKHDTKKIRCKENLERCISEVHTWMHTNLLKLKDNKTEFLLIGTRNMLNQSGPMLIKVGNDNISNADKARNLGVTFDKQLSNMDHINNLSSTLFFVHRNIARVHHLLDQDSTKLIVQLLIMSKPDYCNSLLIS